MKIDLINKRILAELTENSRIPYSKLAKILHISKEAVFQRIKKLEDNEIITKYTVRIDHFKLGLQKYRVKIYFHNKNPEIKKQVFTNLIKNSSLSVIQDLKTSDSFIAYFNIQNDLKLKQLLKNIKTKYEDSLKITEVSRVTQRRLFPRNYFHNTKSNIITDQENEIVKLDEKDNIILKEICLNPKYTYSTIAKKVNMSSDSIKSRIKKLHSEGIIQRYSIIINFSKINWIVMRVQITPENVKQEKDIEEFAHNHNNCREYLTVLEQEFIELRIECENHEHFEKIIEDLKRTIEYKYKHLEYYNEAELIN